VNAHDDHVFGSTVTFQDLVCDAADGSPDVVAVHHLRHRLAPDTERAGPISLLPGLTGPCFKGVPTLAVS
jgi:hypothetical protein